MRNSSPLRHTEKHVGTKTMSAQVGESHASTVKRLSKSPTVANCQSHNARRSTPRNNRVRRETACGPARPPHTSQVNMFSRAANFNCHDMLRTSLSSDTHTPLVSNTTDCACPMPTAPPLPRQRGNTLSAAHEFASDGESNVEPRSLLSQLALNDLGIGKATRQLKHIQLDSQEMDKADVSVNSRNWESAN